MEGRASCLKPTEFVVLIITQAESQEQTEARKAAETHLADAQVQITTLEQKVVELQAQLSAMPKPKVCF